MAESEVGPPPHFCASAHSKGLGRTPLQVIAGSASTFLLVLASNQIEVFESGGTVVSPDRLERNGKIVRIAEEHAGL